AAGALAGVEIELVVQVRRVLRVLLPGGVRIRNERVARERSNGEGIGGKEVVAQPALRQWRKGSGVEFQLDAFAGTEDDEAVVGGAQEAADIAVTSVVAGSAGIRSGEAAMGIRIDGVTGGLKADFLRVAKEGERGSR